MNNLIPEQDSSTKGYLSEESKRKFTITAGVLGALFFIAQFVVPFVLAFSIMPIVELFLPELEYRAAEPQRGAYWENAVWFLEQHSSTKYPKEKILLKKIDLNNGKQPEQVKKLPVESAFLLADVDRLWVISSSVMGYYLDGSVNILLRDAALGSISQPFLYEGMPAVIEERPSGLRLMAFSDNEWMQRFPLRLNLEETSKVARRELQVVPGENKLYLFLRYGDKVYFREGIPVPGEEQIDTWQAIPGEPKLWYAAVIGGKPSIFYTIGRLFDEEILGLKLVQGHWEKIINYRAGRVDHLAVFPADQRNKFFILLASVPGQLQMLEMEEKRIAKSHSYHSIFFFPQIMFFIMFLPHIFTILLPIILAVILSILMRKHRICNYQFHEVGMNYASLIRRAIAQIVDSLIVILPLLAGFICLLNGIFKLQAMSSKNFSQIIFGFSLLGGGLLWAFTCFFLFTYFEGRWGATPGKWLTGIRVLGTDLKPCRFGRALVRNLLKFIDGFFNFLVGIMIVALSENWQRLGDMAARTVVINVKDEDPQV